MLKTRKLTTNRKTETEDLNRRTAKVCRLPVKYRYLLAAFLIVLVAALVALGVSEWQYSRLERENNSLYRQLLEKVVEQYPQIDQTSLLALLGQTEASEDAIEKTEVLLRQYGITENTPVANSLGKWKNRVVMTTVATVIITSLFLLCLFFAYVLRRKRKIQELEKYMHRIAQREYILSIEDNCEDELSLLKNDLYKITIMLREQAENSVRQKEALSKSVSDISHQLKTPLTSILIMLDNLRESEHMPQQTRNKFLCEISRQIEQMNWLVITLLKLSRLDAGVVTFKQEKIRAVDLMTDITDRLEIMAELKEVKFVLRGSENVVFTGDYNWIREAVQNLVKNAVEHTVSRTTVDLSFTDAALYAELTVRDHGHGISREACRHIFERFYKAENAGEQNFGIGLSMAKAIIEQQNGCILVQSDLLDGPGSIFTVRFYHYGDKPEKVQP